MFPETEFHKLGKSLIFIVFQNRLYHTENSANPEKNFISLSGLKFPLKKGEKIQDTEKRYGRINLQQLEKFKEEYMKKINEIFIKTSEETLSKRRDLMFFFREVCPRYNLNICKYLKEKTIEKEEEEKPKKRTESIFERLLEKNYAVVNSRLYPLEQSKNMFFANLEGINYEISSGIMTIEDIECRFFQELEKKLMEEAHLDFERAKKNSEKLLNLEEEIRGIEILAGVKRYKHAYEFGDIGFDLSSKLVYWLLPAHQNETSGRHYGEGESAVTLELNNESLGSTVKFAERSGRDSAFSINANSNCYGGATNMPPFNDSDKNSIDDVMFMLRTCRNMVEEEGRFYQAPTPSSDDGGSY